MVSSLVIDVESSGPSLHIITPSLLAVVKRRPRVVCPVCERRCHGRNRRRKGRDERHAKDEQRSSSHHRNGRRIEIATVCHILVETTRCYPHVGTITAHRETNILSSVVADPHVLKSRHRSRVEETLAQKQTSTRSIIESPRVEVANARRCRHDEVW